MVPLAKVLPPALGGADDTTNAAAFYGDKMLGAAVALAQRRTMGAEQTLDSLLALHHRAVSNEFMLENLPDIMPLHAGLVDQHQLNRFKAHGAGTMVEAAVTAVHDEGEHEAITDLADWLVLRASAQEPVVSSNAKGQLLEFGGTVSSERVGGADNEPTWLAVAVLGEQRMSTRGTGSKVSVEQRAARQLLDSVFSGEY